jgi:phage baseplate assembly protein W
MVEFVRGFGLPFRIDPSTGGVAWSSEEAKIRQNVLALLGTRFGERAMLRDFGTRIPALVHDPNDDVLAATVREQIQTALLRWEPRVFVTAINVQRREGILILTLTYVHTDDGQPQQLAVPLE